MPKTGAETRIALLDLETRLNDVLFEREDAVRAALLSTLAGCNCIFIGPPGSAKSMTLSLLAKAFKARYFQALLSMSSKPDELFGAKDANAYLEGVVRYTTTGMLPDAEIALLDEPCKVNSATGNALLNVLNERTFVNGGVVMELPLLAVFGGANEVPQEEDLSAYYDRFLVRVHVQYIKSATKFAEMICQKQKPIVFSEVSVEDLLDARKEIASVVFNGVASDSVNRVKEALASDGFVLSDRRWWQAARLMEANAWLHGRTSVMEADMEVLIHVAWDLPEDQRRVEKIVRAISNPLDAKALEMMDEARSVMDEAVKRNDAETPQQWAIRLGAASKKLKDGVKRMQEIVAGNPPEVTGKMQEALADLQKAQAELADRAMRTLTESM